AHVGDGGAGQVRLRGQRIEQVVREDAGRVLDRGEVVGPVPALQLVRQLQQLRRLRVGERDAQLRGAGKELRARPAHGALRTKPATYCCTGMASSRGGSARSCSHSAAMRRAWLGVNSRSAAARTAASAASSDSAPGAWMSRVQCWYRVASVGGGWPASTA